jgi:Flp pilus assembly protein TadD
MSKFSALILISLIIMFFLSSCRPPELEGAFVDYKAGRVDAAFKNVKLATEKYPDNAEAWKLLGEIYGQKDQFSDMMFAFNKSLALSNLFETEILNLENRYFQTSFNNAATSYNAFTKIEDRESENAKKAINSAITDFKKSLIIKSNYQALSLIGLCYSILDAPDSSVTYYNRLTVVRPDTADAWLSVGNFYFLNRQYDKCLTPLKKVMEIDPNNVEAITLLAQAYDLLGDRPNAISAYTKAMELNKEEKAFPFNLALLYIKMSSDSLVNETDKNNYLKFASENLDAALKIDSSIKDAWNLKLNALVQLKDFSGVLVTSKQAIERFPEDGDFWYYLAVAYAQLNNKAEAEKAMAKAKELGFQY